MSTLGGNMAVVSTATGDAVAYLSVNGKAGNGEQADDLERQRLEDNIQDQSEIEKDSGRETENDNESDTDNDSDNDSSNDSEDDDAEYVREGVFDFFGLPAELRTMIYDYACSAPPDYDSCLVAVSLTKTSRKVRSEVLPIMFEHLRLLLWLNIEYEPSSVQLDAEVSINKDMTDFVYGDDFLEIQYLADRCEPGCGFLSRLKNVEVRTNDARRENTRDFGIRLSFPTDPLSLPQVSVESFCDDENKRYPVLLKALLDAEFQIRAEDNKPLCWSKDFMEALTWHLEHVARIMKRDELR